MNEKNLLDTYRLGGRDITSLTEALSEIDASTKRFIARGKDLMLLSLCNREEIDTEGFTTCYILTDSYVKDFENGSALHIAKIPNEKIGLQVLEEAKASTGLVVLFENEGYAVSRYALNSLLQRSGIGGKFPVSTNGIVRDIYVAAGLFNYNEHMSVIFREADNGAKKIFAFMGGRFTPVKQSSLLDIVSALEKDGTIGSVALSSYEIDHEFTDIYVSFPDAAKEYSDMVGKNVVPGLVLSTSDIGSCSVTVKGIYTIGNCMVITDEVRKYHTASNSAEAIIKAVDEQIYKDLRKLPETLVRLVGIEVAPTVDLTSAKGQKENLDTVWKVYKDVAEKLFPSAIIGTKTLNKLLNEIRTEVNPEVRYTAYDIAENIMGLCDRLEGLSREAIERMRKACASAPYEVEKYFTAKPPKKEEDVVVLLSA